MSDWRSDPSKHEPTARTEASDAEIAVHGVVITVDPSSGTERRADLIASLKAHSSIEVGEVHENRVPAVIDANSGRESRSVHEWIENRPGVLKVDVVFSAFDRETDPTVEPDPSLASVPTETRGSHEQR